MLGHQVSFKYCRLYNMEIPCRKILDCWHETIPVGEFLHEFYSDEELKAIFNPPPDRYSMLMDLIEKSKKFLPK